MTATTALYRNEGELIKTDCIGRILVSSQNREKLLDAFESSGMSGQQFADHCGKARIKPKHEQASFGYNRFLFPHAIPFSF
jgi:hypothetical protein